MRLLETKTEDFMHAGEVYSMNRFPLYKCWPAVWNRFRGFIAGKLGLSACPAKDMLLLVRKPGWSRVLANPDEVLARIRAKYEIKQRKVLAEQPNFLAVVPDAWRTLVYMGMHGANNGMWVMFMQAGGVFVEVHSENRPGHYHNVARSQGLFCIFSGSVRHHESRPT
jgi:hypothetical protein